MAQRLIGAVEAGGTKFVAALAREDGTVLAQTRLPTETPATTFPALADFFAAASAAHGPIAAFGVASFGPIDIDPASPAFRHVHAHPEARLGGCALPRCFGWFRRADNGGHRR